MTFLPLLKKVYLREGFFSVGADNTTFTGNNWDTPGLGGDANIARRIGTSTSLYYGNPGSINFSTNTPSIMYHTFTNTSLSKGLNGGANGTTQTHSSIGSSLGGNIFGANNGAGTGGDDTGVTGSICEVIVYGAGNITDAERRKVDSYLAIKYGLTLGRLNIQDYLSSSGLSVWSGTANSAYNNNIAGIARDELSLLYQKQSISANSNQQQVIIGLPGMANSNDSNTGTLSDGQFLLWGDNGLSRTPSAAISGVPGTNFRFASVWKVQNTGSVGTVRVMWPQGLNNLKLVQNASDPTFTTGNISTDMFANTQTINGTVYNYADVTLTNGQYFTFAAQVYAPGGVVTGLSLWLKSDEGVTTSGTSVTNWTNQAVPGLSVTQATASKQPVFSANYMNFNPGVNFATNQEMVLLNGNPTIFGTANPLTAFYLGNSTSVAGSRTVLELHTASGDFPTFEWRGTSFGMDLDGSVFQDSGYHSTKTVAANTPYIISSGFNNLNASGQIYNMFNGAFQDIRNGNAFLSANLGLNIYVGGGGGAEYFQGGLPEIIAYNTYVNIILQIFLKSTVI